MDQNYQKGFTLIELLVVIAIIGILAVAVLFSISPAETLKKSRDASRLQEITNLRKSLDSVIATKTAENVLSTISCPYNNPCNSVNGSRSADGTGWLPIDLREYIPALPADPLNNKSGIQIANGTTATIKMYFATDGNVYTMATYLESPQNASKLTNDGGSDANLYEVGTGTANALTIN